MARKSKDQESSEAVDANARFETSRENQKKAEVWFRRARELGEKRQWDYAILYYVNGLEYWPEWLAKPPKAGRKVSALRRSPSIPAPRSANSKP